MDSPLPADPRSGDAARLFAASFLALFTELALIRFLPAYVPAVGYFVNLVLIASFLGLGLGFLVSGTRRLEGLFLPLLLGSVAAVWGLSHVVVANLPESAEILWLFGDESDGSRLRLPLWIPVLTGFVLVVAVSVPVGQAMARLFARLPRLSAYAADLGGSLTGVVAFGLLSALETPPALWFGLAALIALAAILETRRERFAGLVCGLAAVALAAWMGHGSLWSPYYKVDVREESPVKKVIYTNGILHQIMLDLGSPVPENAVTRQRFSIPYRAARSLDDVLIVGAGSGNDVTMALAEGARHVDAVEIDPVFPRLGRELHPNRPYDDPRVELHVTDARSWFSRTDHRYDLIVFGTLDSQALLSGLSSVRLDNYIYTTEAFEAAYRLLKPGGLLAVFHMSVSDFIADRIILLLARLEDGLPAYLYFQPHSLFNFLFLQGTGIPRPTLRPEHLERLKQESIPSDDWPYLYLRERTVPSHYLLALGGMLLLAAGSTGFLLRRRGVRRFDPVLFLLGAGFLLLETMAVTRMSLLFGSTWVVNLLVFSSILAVLFLANLVVLHASRGGRRLPLPLLFMLLAAVLVALSLLPVSALTALPEAARWAAGGLLVALPAGIAGLLFPSLFLAAEDPRAAFGSNLLGAIAGGVTEYLAMIFGISSLGLLAAAFYLLAFLVHRRSQRRSP